MLSINELHQALVSGDVTAEDRLFTRLRERFCLFAHHRIGNRLESEEVVQDALAVIAQQYRSVEIKTSFSAWAYQVLENRILNFLRARQTQRRRQAPLEHAESLPGGSPADSSLRSQLLDCLAKICKINTRYARILSLQYQGYAAKEIGQKLDVTKNNVYVILSRARDMLERCLDTGSID